MKTVLIFHRGSILHGLKFIKENDLNSVIVVGKIQFVHNQSVVLQGDKTLFQQSSQIYPTSRRRGIVFIGRYDRNIDTEFTQLSNSLTMNVGAYISNVYIHV